MPEALDLNLRGLIHVLAYVLVREVEREMAEPAKEQESHPDAEDKTE